MSEESCVSYNLQIIKLILISLLLIFLKNSYFVVRIYSNLMFTYSKNLKGLFPTKAILYLSSGIGQKINLMKLRKLIVKLMN